jgi:hypothetical protein
MEEQIDTVKKIHSVAVTKAVSLDEVDPVVAKFIKTEVMD